MRSVIWILLATSICAASLAEASDKLVMPYDCGLEGGRVTISPAADKAYAVVGELEKQVITTCRRPRAHGCRTLTIHRFVISCDGAGVAWMRVAAAIRRALNRPAWIDHGRLQLVLPADNRWPDEPSCIERPDFALGASPHGRRGSLAASCSTSTQRGAFEHVSLPAGFAPVDELGARLDLATAVGPLQPAAMLGPRGRVMRASVTVGETLVAKVDPGTLVEPIPGLEPYEPNVGPMVAGDEWVTVVRTEPALHAGIGERGPGAAAIWAWLLIAMGCATAAILVRMRSDLGGGRRFAAAAQLARAFAAFSLRPIWRHSLIRKFTDPGTAVSALIEQTSAMVTDLKDAGPLREVLQSELKLVRQRLANVIEAAEEDPGATARMGPQLRALVRELERIRRIAQSAAASLSRGRQGADLPHTVSEAYDVLGVNPDVSEDVLKKIVDALRMSWHPDHARGDKDLRAREERIRQINVAWEMIVARREAA